MVVGIQKSNIKKCVIEVSKNEKSNKMCNEWKYKMLLYTFATKNRQHMTYR